MGPHVAPARWAEFGRRLRARRRAAGLTQAELGRRVGYHHSLISRLEAGERAPSPELLRRLERLLGAGGPLGPDDAPDVTRDLASGGFTVTSPTSLGLTLFAVSPGSASLDLPTADLGRHWPSRLPVAGVTCPVHPQRECAVPAAGDAVAVLPSLRASGSPAARPGRDVDLAHSLAALLAAFSQASVVDCSVDLVGAVERVLQLVVRWLRAAQAVGEPAPVQLRLAAGYAQLAGRMRMHRGQNVLAMAWLGHGMQWAELANDVAARVCLLTDVCTLARLDEDAPSVVSYALGLGAIDPRRGWVATLSHLYQARGYAGSADLVAARRHATAARRGLARLDERDLVEAPWLAGEGGVLRIESSVAGALRDLSARTGDAALARQAGHATRRSLAVLPTSMRPTYLLLQLRLADSLACAGDVDGAVAEAAPVAVEVLAARRAPLTRELAGLRARLQRWREVTAVRELEERLATAAV
ncbi:helix-turn-helix transcriptional regulator [Angustibacter luteus]|uniref:Helix-turn-helix domain-containing protein n=1 Tax=Angustibacter luteus TaxID=658456 RepID=A0ABW1JI94_9ACTN